MRAISPFPNRQGGYLGIGGRRVIGGTPSSPTPLRDTSDFYAPLLTSGALTRGAGSPTFTRASVKYEIDFEGYLILLPSGAITFRGARYVRNLIPTSSASLAPAATKTVTVVPGTFVFSMGAEATGTGVATFSGTATGSTGTLTANATNRTATTLTITVGGTIIITASVQTLIDLQLEEVTGQANQNPSEYVSVGVLSSPYHGLLVDGWKAFTTLNGNTVNSTVVSLATGAAINSNQSAAANGVFNQAVDASGPTGYFSDVGATNLILQNRAFANASWAKNAVTVTANDLVSPDGKKNASRLANNVTTLDYVIVGQGFTASAAAYTHSVYAKAGSVNFVSVGTFDGVGDKFSGFNLSNGTVDVTASGHTCAITAVGNGWYRCSVTYTYPSTTGFIYIGIYKVTGTIQYVPTAPVGTDYLHIWGAQVELSSVVNNLIPTTSTAITRQPDVLSYTAPSTTTTTGTNLILQSNGFDTATWDKNAVTVTANDATAPIGTVTAQRIANNVTTFNLVIVGQRFTASAAAYTHSVYAKAGSVNFVYVGTFDGVGDKFSGFNLSNGTVDVTASGHTCAITAVGNGWYRCSVTYTYPSTTGYIYIGIYKTAGTIKYVPTAPVGTDYIHIWGAQVELSPTATPYVATTVAQATGTAKNWTISCEVTPTALSVTGFTVLLYSAVDTSNAVLLCHDGVGIMMLVVQYGIDYVARCTTALTPGTLYKVAAAFSNDGATVAVNGVAGTASAAITLAPLNSTGATVDVSNRYGINQPVLSNRQVRIWERALSQAQLASLST